MPIFLTKILRYVSFDNIVNKVPDCDVGILFSRILVFFHYKIHYHSFHWFTYYICTLKTSSHRKAGLAWTMQATSTILRIKQFSGHVASPLMAESLALREAVLFCRNKGFASIRFESDSAQLINAIKRNEAISELHGVLSDIRKLSSSVSPSCSFNWIPRTQNVVCDSLAKEALCLVETFMPTT